MKRWMIPLLLLSGCGWLDEAPPDLGPTLAVLSPAELPQQRARLPEVTLEQVAEQYRQVLEISRDPDLQRKVMVRLAGLEMLRSEEQQLRATEMRRFFDEAIALYQGLLAQKPNGEGNDRLLYQIAKAHQMDGRGSDSMRELEQLVENYPNSEFYMEAQFRRGEILFSEQRYRAAEQAYAEVLKFGAATPFYHNALYMLGWSRFKQDRYQASLKPFTQVLDSLLEGAANVEHLSRPQQELAGDVLRVMSLAFSYLHGASSIAATYRELGARPYEHLFYQNLGQLYLDKKRYRDSAETFQAFVEQYPLSDHAPGFNVKTIEVYGAGNFPALVLPAKHQFVDNYGIHSRYWADKSEAVRESLRPHLHRYLLALAQHHHAVAQQQQDKRKQQQERKNPPVKTTEKITRQQVTAAFLEASDWYGQFVETFPDDKATPGVAYLMAESLFDAGEMPLAISAYEKVAYHYARLPQGNLKQGADAGYAAILAYGLQLQALPAGEEKTARQRDKIASARQFATTYRQDKRAAPVLTQAAEALFALKDYPQAVEVAGAVDTMTTDNSLRHTAWLVQGHSQFELQNYQMAEQAYRQALNYVDGTAQRSEIIERLAASVYQQGEQHLAAEQQQLAVKEYLRVKDVAPDSEIAISAQYDAAAHLMAMQQWQQAETVLVAFQQRYPDHRLAVGIPAKLAETWQQLQKWDKAAEQLVVIATDNADPDVRRQSLYLAAELYEKAGDRQHAIEYYRRYAHTYPKPFAVVMEARFKLSELYAAGNEPAKRRFWLQKLIDGQRDAKAAATERSRYLAAFATEVFAAESYREFTAIPLSLPLQKSLKKKRAALEKSLSAYRRVLDYDIVEFTTRANFYIGEMYVVLSRDLLASQRPKLNALELQQYEVLLEEQAYPFEEKAIDIHEANAARLGQGLYDQWVQRSLDSLAELLPARYAKRERLEAYSREIF